jgi:hypothetical protein
MLLGFAALRFLKSSAPSTDGIDSATDEGSFGQGHS